jgi:hypothetical protein
MGRLPVVLCIADTTELNFNGQDIEGAGPLSYEAQVGMYLHATFHATDTVTPAREPLGVMNAWMWAREPRERRDANGRRGGVRESVRWIESYEIVAGQARALPDARLVYVADREGDIEVCRAQRHTTDSMATLRFLLAVGLIARPTRAHAAADPMNGDIYDTVRLLTRLVEHLQAN